VDRAAHVATKRRRTFAARWWPLASIVVLQPPLHDVSASLMICQKAIVALLR
jgi:hypothetical protein